MSANQKPPAKPRTKAPAKTKRRTGRVVLWVVLSLILVLVVTAGGLYLWYDSLVRSSNARVDPDVVAALQEQPTSTTSGESAADALVTAPASMNLVLLGSDTRSTTGKGGRSDTIILVHIDSQNDFLSMLSIPRDLRVKIPGHGYNKINAAYAYGGPALVIRTVQSVMGIDLDHYVETDFTGFKAIADALGGVYVDVDRTYDDGKIQLKPGYQLLNGQNALRFCRTRHDFNIDFGRMQRQQRYLSAVREQAMGWSLAFKLPGLIHSTFDSVDTELTANEVLKLAWWAVGLDGSRIKMATLITGTGTLDGISFVLASDRQIRDAVNDFLTPPPAVTQTDTQTPEQLLQGAQSMLPATPGSPPAAASWRKLQNAAGFPLLAPTYLPPSYSYSYQRSYSIKFDGQKYPTIRVGYRLGKKDQYLGVGATTWLDAPLASPGRQVESGGTVYTIVGTATKADHVWWVKDDVLYWVANTLMYEVSRKKLLAVAISAASVE